MKFLSNIFILLILIQVSNGFKKTKEKLVIKDTSDQVAKKHPKAMVVSMLSDENDGHEDHKGHRGHRKDDRNDDRDWNKGWRWGKDFAKSRGGGHKRGPPPNAGFRVRGPIKMPRGGRGGPITAGNTNVINVKVNVIQENNKQKARR